MNASMETFQRVVAGFREAETRLEGSDQAQKEGWRALLDNFLSARREQRELDRISPHIDLLEVIDRGADERIHCKLLQWLLDPNGSHGQGPAFLDAFLRAIGMDASESDSARVVPEECGDESRIDIEILTPRCLVHIEAKIDAGEGVDQTLREARDLSRKAEIHGIPRERTKAVFITRSGQEKLGDGIFKVIRWGDLAEYCKKVSVEHSVINHVLACFDRLSGGTP